MKKIIQTAYYSPYALVIRNNLRFNEKVLKLNRSQLIKEYKILNTFSYIKKQQQEANWP